MDVWSRFHNDCWPFVMGCYGNKETFWWSVIDSLQCGACLDPSYSPNSSGKGKSKSSIKKSSHGFHLVEGKSGHAMEDYHVAEYRKEKNHELGLFAIFDGHLGNRVPSYLKDHLFNNILDEVHPSFPPSVPCLLLLPTLSLLSFSLWWCLQPTFWKDPATAIKNAYRSTNHFILENSMELGPGGSTAVTAIVIDGKGIWVANIGDSRAVVCVGGFANQLTVDHEPHTERKRIEKQGGFVITFPGNISPFFFHVWWLSSLCLLVELSADYFSYYNADS